MSSKLTNADYRYLVDNCQHLVPMTAANVLTHEVIALVLMETDVCVVKRMGLYNIVQWLEPGEAPHPFGETIVEGIPTIEETAFHLNAMFLDEEEVKHSTVH